MNQSKLKLFISCINVFSVGRLVYLICENDCDADLFSPFLKAPCYTLHIQPKGASDHESLVSDMYDCYCNIGLGR